jgi:hypothetical protein
LYNNILLDTLSKIGKADPSKEARDHVVWEEEQSYLSLWQRCYNLPEETIPDWRRSLLKKQTV